MIERVLCGLAALILIPAIYEMVKLAIVDKKHADREHLKRCLNLTKRKH